MSQLTCGLPLRPGVASVAGGVPHPPFGLPTGGGGRPLVTRTRPYVRGIGETVRPGAEPFGRKAGSGAGAVGAGAEQFDRVVHVGEACLGRDLLGPALDGAPLDFYPELYVLLFGPLAQRPQSPG